MKTIYLDSEFRCHVKNDGEMTPVDTGYFDNKCDTFIEGYRFVPVGQIWIREDGEVFSGEMFSPWKPYDELDQVQREYEKELYEQQKLLINDLEQQAQAAKILLGVE